MKGGGNVSNMVLMQLEEYKSYRNIDFTIMGEEAEKIAEQIHFVAMRELMSRELTTVWDWEMRTGHMFENNNLRIVRDITVLSQGQVNRLHGCGQRTRKEVYDVFCVYHLRLKHWQPKEMNYKF